MRSTERRRLADAAQRDPATDPPAPAPAPPLADLLALQRAAGNAAVARILRQPAPQGAAAPPAPAARTPAQVDALIGEILTAVAEHETGQRAVESNMRTSSGVRASYASQVQGTAAWTITALRRLPAADRQAFGVTVAELNAAEARAVAAGRIWDAVMASPAAETAAGFAAANAADMTASGLNQNDLTRMFQFRDLRTAITARQATERTTLEGRTDQEVFDAATARERSAEGIANVAQCTGARRTKLIARVARRLAAAWGAQQTEATTLGINQSSLDAYLRGNWAEDRAAWQRVAVGRDPGGGDIGQRIENAATRNQGLDLGRARIGNLVRTFLADPVHANATDNEVCRHVASRHNPGAGARYVDAVEGHFDRFRQAAQPAAPAGGAPAAPPAGGAPAAPAQAPAGAAPAAPAPPAPAPAGGQHGALDGTSEPGTAYA